MVAAIFNMVRVLSMGLLDDDIEPLWQPPKSKRYHRQTTLSQEERDKELNNFDREEESLHYKQPDN